MPLKTALTLVLSDTHSSDWFVPISLHSFWGYNYYLAVSMAAITCKNITEVKHWHMLSNKESDRWPSPCPLREPLLTPHTTCPWAEKERMGVGWWSICALLLLPRKYLSRPPSPLHPYPRKSPAHASPLTWSQSKNTVRVWKEETLPIKPAERAPGQEHLPALLLLEAPGAPPCVCPGSNQGMWRGTDSVWFPEQAPQEGMFGVLA